MMRNFVNPWFLAGLAGAAIPIIIHILTRDRIRKVAFSTLRFFVQGARVTLRRKRWTEMVLILLRVLVCILIALIFARPFLKAGSNGHVYRAARMVVADVSASMARAGGTPAIVAAARQAVGEVGDDAAVGVLAFDGAVRELAPLGADPAAAQAAVATLEPGEGATDMAAALRQANTALQGVKAARKDIVFISDAQRAGLEHYRGDWKLDPGVVLHPVVLGVATGGTDVGIADAQVPQNVIRDGLPRTVAVRIVNRGATDLPEVPVALWLDGHEADRQAVRIPAGASTAVRFRHMFDRAGDNPGEVRVVCDDLDGGDNRFYFNVRVVPEIPVLLVGRGAAGQNGAGFFLQAALNPGAGSSFSVKALAAADVRPEAIAAASVVILADVAPQDPALVAAAGRLLERGGGLLFMPADGTTPEALAAWSALTPCRLKRTITRRSATGEAQGEIARLDATHPVFEVFQRPHHGDFSAVRFARYWDVGESQASRVLARYDDGRPAILERQIGQGVATIWLSPPDLAWNNLPLRAVFLPLLHETVRQAAVRAEWPTAFSVGQAVSLPPGYTPRTQSPTGTVDVAGWGTGIHALTNAQGQAFALALNRPAAECDAQRFNAQELKAALERPAVPAADAAGSTVIEGHGREWWGWLALALALLLPAELWLGNVTARH